MSKFQWRHGNVDGKWQKRGVWYLLNVSNLSKIAEQQERRITVMPACVDTSLFNILERRGPSVSFTMEEWIGTVD